ncbi:MAG: PspC domain-containing protein [Chloroflexi bacterium]|nr:PspC domain-containing protein [Chloroflexota bacterium]
MWNDRSGPRRLQRSSRERMWAGVSGGMAEYFDLDPTLMRLIWVVGTVVTAGLLVPVYFLLWVIMPVDRDTSPAGWAAPGGAPREATYASMASDAPPSGPEADAGFEDTGEPDPQAEPRRRHQGAAWQDYGYGYDWHYYRPRKRRGAGFILIALGLLFLGAQTHLFSAIPWNVAWPAVLIVLGGALLMRNRDWRL